MLVTVRVETLQGTPVARVVGEVDASNARELTARLTDSVPNTAMGLVVDLTPTTYLDSSGVQMLFAVADALRRRQQDLRLVASAESFISDVLAAVNLGASVQLDPSVAEAITALKSP